MIMGINTTARNMKMHNVHYYLHFLSIKFKVQCPQHSNYDGILYFNLESLNKKNDYYH